MFLWHLHFIVFIVQILLCAQQPWHKNCHLLPQQNYNGVLSQGIKKVSWVQERKFYRISCYKIQRGKIQTSPPCCEGRMRLCLCWELCPELPFSPNDGGMATHWGPFSDLLHPSYHVWVERSYPDFSQQSWQSTDQHPQPFIQASWLCQRDTSGVPKPFLWQQSCGTRFSNVWW